MSSIEFKHQRLLDAAERERRAAYVRQEDRDRFTLGAALLRLALARSLDCFPEEITIDRRCPRCGRQHGRPSAEGSGHHVSVTHAGGLVCAAITTVAPVGVDIEAIRSLDVATFERSVMAADEPPSARHRLGAGLASDDAFFVQWTRKEAVLKATGDGLPFGMPNVVVIGPRRKPLLVRYGDAPPPAATMADLDVGPRHVGTVAVLTDEPMIFSTEDAQPILAW